MQSFTPNPALKSGPVRSLKRQVKRQAGFAIESTVLALLIMALAAAAAYKSALQADMVSLAVIQADSLKNVANAAETLVMEHYDSYQAGLPVTRNGVTLDFGAAPGESMTPTLANLRAMAVGLTPGSDTGNYKTLVDATYITQIERVPAGCEASPAGQTCNIQGMVCLDRPVQELGAPVGETDDLGIGAMLGRIGGDSGTSFAGSAGNIIGAGGAWTRANPFVGTPIGIVCQRFGFGSAAFGRFLRVRDSRNPDFQGSLTVNNNINTTNGTIGSGTGTANPSGTECRLGEILASGAFFSRSLTCIKRAWVDGSAGEIGVADVTGTPRAQLKDTGELVLRDAAGNIKAGFIANGADVDGKADNFTTNAGTAGLRANGEAFGNSLVINTSAAAGAACPTNDAMVWGNGTNTLRLLKCVANVWTLTEATGTAGAACTPEGRIVVNAAGGGGSLVCRNGFYRPVQDLFGQAGVMTVNTYNHGDVVPLPTCSPQMTPRRQIMGVISACVNGGGSICANNTGAINVSLLGPNSDTVWLYGADGSIAGPGSQATVGTFCSVN